MLNNFINKIFHSKWEDILNQIPSYSIDCIITSPPYNVSLGIGNKHKTDSYLEYKDDLPYQEYLKWMKQLFIECNRILKKGGRLCINIGDGQNGRIPTHADFTNILVNEMTQNLEKDCLPFKMLTTIVWDKHQIGASTAWGSWLSPSSPSFPTQFEYILIVGKGQLNHDGKKATVSKDNFIRNSRALWTFPPETTMKTWGHPAMFPEELPKRLIEQLTYEDDIILDPFSGMGTTCAVAKKMKRRYIGIEKTKEYQQKSILRLQSIPEFITIQSDGKERVIPSWLN